ncbi:MAG: MgtC/SapB family protein [Saprospiraceae bacterium]|nr:MgtC/SapB family protein [Saprospiraceae bacterium]
MDLTAFVTRLLLSIACGLAIGIEREWRNKAAGLKTNTLVALGSAIYVMLGQSLIREGQDDVTRVIGQVVVGVGFLGAGVILRGGGTVHGLNTAATVWVTAAIGCMVGIGWVWPPVIGSVIVVIINILLHIIEEFFDERDGMKTRLK